MQPSLSVNRFQTPSNTQNLSNVRLTKFYLFLTCTTFTHTLISVSESFTCLARKYRYWYGFFHSSPKKYY